MDDSKKTVLVAALSAYIDLLAKNTARLDLEQGKGKGKASDDDVDLTAEIQNQIKLCSELTDSINSASSGDDIARTFEQAGAARNPPKNEQEGLKNALEKSSAASKSQTGNNWWTDFFQDFCPSTVLPNQQTKPNFSKSRQSYIVDNEPSINPFTGLPIILETGCEAGPSNRPPAPLREPPRPPRLQPTVTTRMFSTRVDPTQEPPRPPLPSSRPLSLPLELSSKAPTRPPPKPSHLRATPIVPPRPTSTRSTTSHPQRSAPPPPPLLAPEPEQLQRRLIAPVIPPEYSLTSKSGVTQEPVATELQADTLNPQIHHQVANISSRSPGEQQPISPPPPFDWEADIQDVREVFPRGEGQVPNTTHKRKYLHHISKLALMTLKAAGSMISLPRSPSVALHQSQSLGQRETVNSPVELAELPDYTSVAQNTMDHVSTRPLTGNSQQRVSQESLPPAYDTLPHASRSSLSSISSAAQSSIWTTSPPFSSRTSISSVVSPSASSSPDAQRHSIWTASPSMASSINSSLDFQGSGWPTTSPTVNSLERSVSSPLSPNTAPGVNSRAWTPSATSPARRTSNPSMRPSVASLRAKLQKDFPRRQHTVSSESSRLTRLVAFGDDQVAADAAFAKSLLLEDTNSVAWELSGVSSLSSPNINPGLDQQTSYTQKRQSATIPPLNPPGSSKPWRDHLEADEALAKSLQQEEYHNMQLERDLQLAQSLANGTAVDGDVELAYFMAQDTAALIASADTVASGSHTSFDLWGTDRKSQQIQLDWLEARELEKELRAKDAADEASFSEAMRLQAKFDKEAQDEEAWEAWKKGNIEECIICGVEQHREEFVRSCEHGYCNSCLQDGFKNALASRTPFKCCKKALSIEGCSGLSTNFVTEYEEMMLELSTPNPMYCYNAGCTKFLPPRVIVGDVGTCQKCRRQTCRHCRRRIHPGTFCAEDKETEAVKQLAKKKGWKTCPGCNHLIERHNGCLHMTCSRCHTAFCYRCSKRWTECQSTCPETTQRKR